MTRFVVIVPGEMAVAEMARRLDRAGVRDWEMRQLDPAAGMPPAVADRIAQAHCKQVGAGGVTSGTCAECGWLWPCATFLWASGQVTDTSGPWEQDTGNVRPLH